MTEKLEPPKSARTKTVSMGVLNELADWFNNLPDGGMGKEHLDGLVILVSDMLARRSPGTGKVEEGALAAEVVGCFEAAMAEGLIERLEECTDRNPGSLYDLVRRRLLPAQNAAFNALTASSGTPAGVRVKGLEATDADMDVFYAAYQEDANHPGSGLVPDFFDNIRAGVNAVLARYALIPTGKPEHDTTASAEGWQPIETAPKDGSKFLAVCYGQVVVCRWGSGRYDRSKKVYLGGWAVGMDNKANPTHWMPLPVHPTPVTEERSEP